MSRLCMPLSIIQEHQLLLIKCRAKTAANIFIIYSESISFSNLSSNAVPYVWRRFVKINSESVVRQTQSTVFFYPVSQFTSYLIKYHSNEVLFIEIFATYIRISMSHWDRFLSILIQQCQSIYVTDVSGVHTDTKLEISSICSLRATAEATEFEKSQSKINNLFFDTEYSNHENVK